MEMISAESNNATSPCNESRCDDDGSASPSSLRDSQSRASTQEHNNHSPLRHDDISSDDPADFASLRSPSSLANISANIELHPQNEALGGSSKQKYIKRPLNAYMIWTRQERKRILAEDSKMKMNEVSKAIQMGERWKKLSDREKKPYFELAKKYSEEHKQVLQDHPELQYAPSKKKGPPKKSGDTKQSMADSSSVKSCTATPDASRSTTPRGSASLIAPQPISQSQVFSPFQTPLAPSVHLAQVLQGVRSAGQFGQASGNNNSSMSSSLLAPTPTFPQAFLQPQSFPQRVSTSSALLSGISQSGSNPAQNSTARTTPGQMLDLYYTSLCQPAFPNIAENPVNPLGMYPPHYLLEQYNQQLNQQQQQQQGSGNSGPAGSNTNGGGQF